MGFPEATYDESTIWIGSKGAHTSCHIDTYGFNLVCQIFGRKLWVLFPPDENLRPTRLPYEESSIFSELNFFSPTIKEFQGISNAHILTLNPGDVLYVPHGWWHYVENLDAAISINVWLPSPEDDSERVKEALVQFLVKQIYDISNKVIQNKILDPNMLQMETDNSKTFLDMIMTTLCIDESNVRKKYKKVKKDLQDNSSKIEELSQTLIESGCIKKILKATHREWLDFLHSQLSRCENKDQESNQFKHEGDHETKIVRILKAFTDPDVISLIQSKLSKK